MRMRPLVRLVSLALLIAGVSKAAQAQIAVGHLADYSGATSDVGAAYGQAVADTFAWVNKNGGVGGKPLSIDTGDYGYQVPRAIARIRAGRPGRLQTCCSHPGQCVDRVGSNVELNSLASS